MAKMIKSMSKIKNKNKTKGMPAPEQVDEEFWQEKLTRKFNFDDENDESNQTDFLGFFKFVSSLRKSGARGPSVEYG